MDFIFRCMHNGYGGGAASGSRARRLVLPGDEYRLYGSDWRVHCGQKTLPWKRMDNRGVAVAIALAVIAVGVAWAPGLVV